MKKRYLLDKIVADLNDKMVFVSGARQVGKTSLAEYIAGNFYSKSDCINWDYKDDRRRIIEGKFRSDSEIILFDEIHKYKDWKNYLKGQFDKHKNDFKMLVT